MEEIAAVYARSLFAVAREHDSLDVVREQLGEFSDALAAQQPLQMFFFSPYFSTEEKKKALTNTVEGAEPIFMNFLMLLLEKNRIQVLFRMRKSFDSMWEEFNLRLPVQVTSAIPLDDAIVKDIGDRIAAQTGRKVELTSDVEPDILGGIVIKVGNYVLDASIRQRLERLRKQVVKAT